MAAGETRRITRTMRSRAYSVEVLGGKRLTSKNRSISTHTLAKFPIVEPDPMEALMAKFSLKSSVALKNSKLRTLNFKQSAHTVRRDGIESAVSKDIVFYDSSVLQAVLRHFNSEKRWDIRLASEYLPPIIAHLDDKVCGSICAHSFDIITSKLLVQMITFSRCKPSLGIDVAAEERKEQSKLLRELRNSKKVPVMKISEDDSILLNEALSRLRAI